MSIKIAFSAPTATPSEQDQLFQQYQVIGYDGLQLKHGQYAQYLLEPELFLEQWGHLPGIASALIMGGQLNEETIQTLKPIVNFAKKLGTDKIVFCHGVSRATVTHNDIKDFGRKLSQIGLYTAEQGVKLSLHHHYDQPVMYREDFDLFFENAEQGSIGLTVDTAHLVKSGIADVAEVLSSFSSVIDNIHLKDIKGNEWKVLGEGTIDFTTIFNQLAKQNYQGWISADEESGGDLIVGMQSCYSFINSMLHKS
ncbi:sugar phosphate isomerase/epimerase family protein [Paenibacillus endoradicis]|uniref:sugar phosphate isomerase/epimerase family protein n=1 Tax=Paenibacillus endoradicis TaxID=2972487 RepID=UPI002159A4E4|nr:sugar phosphate isomerase/epimerase [Paenibacillus endoradicis]MCR8656554.1 sugar phosphate isomerase/epimerase [Paenibacillus endoradicis]